MLGFFFDAFDTAIMSLALPSVTADWTLTSFQGGLIGSASLWGMGIGALTLGFLSDVYGRRIVMVITVLGVGLFTGLSALSFSPESLIAFRFITGLFIGAMIPIDLAYVAEIAPLKRRGLFLAALGLMWPVGQVAAAITASFVVPTLGWRVLFVIGIVPALFALWIRARVPESPRWLAKKGRLDEAVAVARRLGANVSVDDVAPSEEEGGRRSWRAWLILFSPKYAVRTFATSALFFLHQFQSYGWAVWVPTILFVALGYDLKGALSTTILLYVGSIIGRLVLLFTADRIGRRPAMMTTYAVMAVCCLSVPALLGLGNWTVVFVAILFVYNAANESSPLQIWIAELFPTEVRGIGSSFASAAGRVGGGIGPIVFGLLMDAEITQWVFFTIAICAVLIILITRFVLRIETSGRSLARVGAV
nr:MFS transporter [Microbacterium ulmi]